MPPRPSSRTIVYDADRRRRAPAPRRRRAGRERARRWPSRGTRRRASGAAASDSTSSRTAGSSAASRAIHAAASSGSRSSAASNRSRTRRCGGCHAVVRLDVACACRSAQLAEQPGARQRPAPLQRRRRHAERVGGLLDAETGEVAQLDDPRLLGVDLLEPRRAPRRAPAASRPGPRRPRASRTATRGSGRPIASARRARGRARPESAASIARRCRRSGACRSTACRRPRAAGRPRARAPSPAASARAARGACTRRRAGAARRRRAAPASAGAVRRTARHSTAQVAAPVSESIRRVVETRHPFARAHGEHTGNGCGASTTRPKYSALGKFLGQQAIAQRPQLVAIEIADEVVHELGRRLRRSAARRAARVARARRAGSGTARSSSTERVPSPPRASRRSG